MSRDGDFELITLRNGARAVRHLGHGEVMHPSIGPWQEALRLYVEQPRLADRLLTFPGLSTPDVLAAVRTVIPDLSQVEVHSAYLRESLAFPYEAGLAFAQVVYGDGGFEAFNEVYAKYFEPGHFPARHAFGVVRERADAWLLRLRLSHQPARRSPYAADASWAAADMCVQTHGGFGFAEEYDVERKFRETRLYQVAPISTNLILSYIAEHVLGLPRSY